MEFNLSWFDTLRMFLAIGAILTIPGWALITTFDTWKNWGTLQRWIIAIGLSVSFYPIIFYSSRVILPELQIGPNKNLAILIAGLVWILWRLRGELKDQFQFDRMEIIAIFLFTGTLVTRYYLAITRPFPAWSDSLHHTLLTELVGHTGKLPVSLEPFAPTSLEMYHLGLYSITGPLMQLANVPAHTALLWMAQTLNGLCGLGIYLILDCKVSRKSAVAGAAFAGLIFHMPAYYVNWGRFTQVTSQAILLVALVVTWQTMIFFKSHSPLSRDGIFMAALAGSLNAAIFLHHFRIAGLYAPLLGIVVLWELCGQKKIIRIQRNLVAGLFLIAFITILLIGYPFKEAVGVYIQQSAARAAVLSRPETPGYHNFRLNSVPYLAANGYLLAISIISTVLIILRRHRLGLIIISWSTILIIIGEIYRLKIPVLTFTNIGTILIMFYIPLSIINGIGIHIILREFYKTKHYPFAVKVLSGLLIIFSIYGGYLQTQNLEEYRFFVTDADLQAMAWINENTPPGSNFAIRTFMWLNSIPHGIDGGYWIPYFTNHQTTSSTMLVSLEKGEYHREIINMSRITVQLPGNPEILPQLCDYNVDYFYIGEGDHFGSPELFYRILIGHPYSKLVYDESGVSIFQICGEN